MTARTAPLPFAHVLPHALPECANARLALFAFRRFGGHGLADARGAQAMFAAFGEGFRRPLTLLRAFMADVAATAALPIAIAPCCCARMTAAEDALLTALARAETRPDSAALLLGDLLGVRHAEGVLAGATAVAVAFADEGRPIVR